MDQLSLFGTAASQPQPGPALPDGDARTRIQSDLATSLLVEAGAGAGKTTEMVRRMVALVRTGTARSSEIAAVTFTRKAAAELRERFQTALERELHAAIAGGDAETAGRLDAALREIDRAFLGTIHAFCARLLRERPLDAGLDPAFRETLGAEEVRLRRRFWHTHLERLAAAGDPSLVRLREIGLQPQQLEGLFVELAGQPDVEYPSQPVPRPDASGIRRRIETLMDGARQLEPDIEPPGGWDKLQTSLRMLRFHRWVLGWSGDARFLDILGALGPASFGATKKKWQDGDAAKRLERDFAELFEDGGAVHSLLRQWWAYRYPIALEFARFAAGAYEAERVRAGTLNFQDLLMFAARLLRDSPAARRELSDRYRFLLVDEFQDTDPIQAEVLFLLASDEELHLFAGDDSSSDDGWHPAFAAWRYLAPRPGALFVVGDPKQSIYRFRRADMMLYQQVKRRFESFGAVVELTSNFRSRKPVEEFVNQTFEQRFAADSDEVQARFAPMRVQPTSDGATAGVFWYELDDPVNSKVPQLARQDSERVATWIATRIEAGQRRAGDFLVLTPNTKWLARYASALESRNVPVQVTGAGVGGPESIELDELRLLLRALCDPGDASLAVATLVGLFLGLDYEQLMQHAERWADVRAPFSFTGAWPDAVTPTEMALARLHRFWQLGRREPADVAIQRMVDELGLLPFAAAGELGGSRAGALLFALDAVRATALGGDASLTGALAALDAALDEDESEAPLEPGRSDVVRVMNLHKAKGLEAPVVVLAMPFGDWSPAPTRRVVRDATGRGLGYATVTEPRGRNQTLTLAQPADWDAHCEAEQRFGRAEAERLLYVAATRAGQELVVGCAYNPNSPSRWRSFHDWLKQHGTPLVLPQPARAEREELRADADEMRRRIAEADAARGLLGRPTYRVAAVTRRKAEVDTARRGAASVAAGANNAAAAEASPGGTSADSAAAAPAATGGVNAVEAAAAEAAAGRGTDWGTAVHDALQYAAEGLTGETLRATCRSRLIALDRPLGPNGEPLELEELLATVASVRESEIWRRSESASLRLVEVPFAVSFTAADYARALGFAQPADDAAPLEIVDGRIDLVFREGDRWVIVDYKSDAAGDRIPAELMGRYRAQLALYAAAWERIVGERVGETVLLFTAERTGAGTST
jgi:ATP-dependent helicase/nuclease subunit A